MIRKLRKKFIRIAMLAVTLVLLLLTLIVNTANFYSTDSELTETIELIYNNQGTIPDDARLFYPDSDLPPSRQNDPAADFPKGPFNRETPFSTRYFCLRFDSGGSLYGVELDHIAAVTESDAGDYAQIALRHGEGYGYCSGYKYYVVKHSDDRYMAIFLDCYQQMRAVKAVLIWSAAADAICIGLVYVLVLLFSRKAVDPVVRSAEQQKQFITDASHELKTPITVIATSLKLLEMENGKQKWLDKAQAQTEKLKELVNSLVALSRMDEEVSPLKHELFQISDSVADAAASFEEYALSKGHELIISVDPDIEYTGDEYAVRQLVSILLDNAVKYADPDTPISFSMCRAKKGVQITASNQCADINEEDTKKLFDRFYRADRSRNAYTGGFGIGLSIAQSIAQGHKGTIKAVKTGSTIEFVVQLH